MQKPIRLSFILVIILLLAGCLSRNASKEMTSRNETFEESFEETNDTDTALHGTIPQFPFPPPTPSTSVNLPKSIFKKCNTLGDTDTLISAALWECGYERKSYYRAPNGFVLITQLEQIDKDAIPQPSPYRFNQTKVPNFMNGFSLNEYFRVLFTAKPGYYRCFAFMITDTITTFTGETPEFNEVSSWLATGGDKLPDHLSQMPLTNKYSFKVLVYEFQKEEFDTRAIQTNPSNHTCLTHLKNVNLWHQLQNQ